METSEQKIRPEIWVVKLRATSHFDDKLVSLCEDIYAVYVYDRFRNVYCCEVTPSYELRFVEFQATGDVSEAVHDHLTELAAHEEPVAYYHCSVIDRLPKIDGFVIPTQSCQRILWTQDQNDEDSDTTMEEALEYLRGNSI